MAEKITRTTVVFDLGGVLIRWDPRLLYRQLLPEAEVDGFLEEVGFAAWNHQQDGGRPWVDAVAAHSRLHPHRRELLAAYVDRFGETIPGPVEGSVEVLAQLRDAGVRLLALTNWSAELFPVARERFSFLQWFEAIVVSGEEGVAKPDAALWQVLIDRKDVRPQDTVYVDDAPANVAAATALGFRTVHFTSALVLRRALGEQGVLDPLA